MKGMSEPSPAPEKELSLFALFGLATIPFWILGGILAIVLHPWLFLSMLAMTLLTMILVTLPRLTR
jgi:hypothetical protein